MKTSAAIDQKLIEKGERERSELIFLNTSYMSEGFFPLTHLTPQSSNV